MTESILLDDGARPLRWLPSWLDRLGSALLAEQSRWVLWLPVAWGCGIVTYFELPAEPPSWVGGTVVAAAGLALAGLRGRAAPVALHLLLMALLAAALGFALSQLRTALVEAPMLQRQIGPVRVEGRVVSQDALPAGVRVVLSDLTIERLEAAATPRQVRIRLRRSEAPPPTGARLAVRAMLGAPGSPPVPGAYDFRRQAFFDGIGGVGYAVGPVRVLTQGERGSIGLWIEDLRQRIAARVNACLSGDEAAISIAMLTGLRGAISDHANAVMRDSGLTHLLSISGTHVGAVVILIFMTARLLLALIEPLALRYPIKKWAALIALCGTVFYCLLVGTPAPTLRSCLTAGAAMFAIMVDRSPLSLRLLAWAAVAVMATTPESVLGPSFQMSFGAVLGLLAFYEKANRQVAVWRADRGRWIEPVLYAYGVTMATVIATLATAPFGLYHFQRLATYGGVSNLLAIPLTSFWIMPLVLLTYPLLPFGLEELAVVPMGWGVTAMLWVADIAAGWPGSVVMVPPMPVWGLGAMVFGGLWLCIWRPSWRWYGLAGVLLGLSSIAFSPQPDVLVSGDGELMAVRGAAGDLLVSTDSGDRFTRDFWLRRSGQTRAEVWPESGPSADGTLSCDSLGCLYRRAGFIVALDRSPLAVAEDCAVADVVVATVRVPRFCQADTVIDRFDLWRGGTHVIYLRSDGPVVETVAESVGDRPWTIAR